MIADTVFRTIGHQRFGVPGTWRSGADAVRQILRQKQALILVTALWWMDLAYRAIILFHQQQ